MTLRDAYAMGRYVTRHPGTVGAGDRSRELCLAVDARYTRGDWDGGYALQSAYMLGRDKFARTGEY